MSAEPDKFYVGVVDLFSVILPGAALCYVIQFHQKSLSWLLPDLSGLSLGDYERGAVFLVSSYVLGHFVFLFGSLLDEHLYERLRSATVWNQKARMAKKRARAWALTQWLALRLFGPHPDQALQRVIELKQAVIPDLDGRAVVNAFQWSKARLAVLSPSGLGEVQRAEADSKFFRSFSVVLLVGLLSLSLQASHSPHTLPLLLCIACLGALSVWRYIDRRFKATQLAYWHLISVVCTSRTGGAADD